MASPSVAPTPPSPPSVTPRPEDFHHFPTPAVRFREVRRRRKRGNKWRRKRRRKGRRKRKGKRRRNGRRKLRRSRKKRRTL